MTRNFLSRSIDTWKTPKTFTMRYRYRITWKLCIYLLIDVYYRWTTDEQFKNIRQVIITIFMRGRVNRFSFCFSVLHIKSKDIASWRPSVRERNPVCCCNERCETWCLVGIDCLYRKSAKSTRNGTFHRCFKLSSKIPETYFFRALIDCRVTVASSSF